jgi:hypothetical protein
MATYKITFVFGSSVNAVGWTENWWVNAADANAAVNSVTNYLTVRKALMLDTAAITNIRASNIDKNRDGILASVGGATGIIPSATQPPAGIWDCLLCRRDDATHTAIGHMFLHLVPSVIFNGRVYVPNPAGYAAWAAAMTAFQTEVKNGTYLVRKRTAPNTYSYVPCGFFDGTRRTSRKLGRPFDALHGRRQVA